jgi:hypothetical protein
LSGILRRYGACAACTPGAENPPAKAAELVRNRAAKRSNDSRLRHSCETPGAGSYSRYRPQKPHRALTGRLLQGGRCRICKKALRGCRRPLMDGDSFRKARSSVDAEPLLPRTVPPLGHPFCSKHLPLGRATGAFTESGRFALKATR